MLNKDKRSLILSLVLGDGCLHYYKRANNRLYGGLTIAHAVDQADYIAWKAQLVSKVSGRSIKLRPVKKRNNFEGSKSQDQIQFALCWKRLRAWRKFCYPNNKKDASRLLRFIRHPELAIAVWLMDDGYAECKKDTKTGTIYSTAFRIFICSESKESQQLVIAWFQKTFDITPKVHFQKSKRSPEPYPFLRLSNSDSLKLWKQIREFVLQFKSMQHKFRHAEQVYQRKLIQPELRS